jgi:saccharopine dehydrogenase (NAD+, L-lysine-forming)
LVSAGKHLDVVAIDHLPTLLPRESSEAFCEALLPSIKELEDWKNARVWSEVDKLFHDKLKEAEASQ